MIWLALWYVSSSSSSDADDEISTGPIGPTTGPTFGPIAIDWRSRASSAAVESDDSVKIVAPSVLRSGSSRVSSSLISLPPDVSSSYYTWLV